MDHCGVLDIQRMMRRCGSIVYNQEFMLAENLGESNKGLLLRPGLMTEGAENVWFVGVYKKNESVTVIHARTVLKGG